MSELSISGHNALAAVRLSRMLFDQFVPRCISLVAKLGVADQLEAGPRTVDELAAQVGMNPAALYRVLRLLAANGVFEERGPRRFANNEMSSSLRANAGDSVRPLALLLDLDWHRAVLDDLVESVRTGDPAFDRLYGTNVFEWVGQHADSAEILHSFIRGFGARSFPPVLASYDFGAIGTFVDVAAGQGHDLAKLLQAYPAMRAVCYELPFVVERARAYLTEHGVAHRVDFVGGDMHESVPAGGDLYFLKQIMHNWSDAHAIRILRNCHTAMGGKGKLLLAEFVVDAEDGDFAKLVDIWMLLLTTGGRNRTVDEHRRNLAEAGFRITNVLPTGSSQTLIEAAPI